MSDPSTDELRRQVLSAKLGEAAAAAKRIAEFIQESDTEIAAL